MLILQQQLIPLLLRGLELPDNAIRNDAIDTFLAAAEGESPEKNLVSEHSSTLVNSAEKQHIRGIVIDGKISNRRLPSTCLITQPPFGYSKFRISALRYLAVLPDIVRYDVLHPHKPTVLRELSKVLDDPKRSVRKEAVNARTKW